MKTLLLSTLFLFAMLKISLAFDPVALSGVVSNAHNGANISDISIFVEDLKTGTITNQQGNFLLYLKEGNYKIMVTGKGFQKKEIEIKLYEDQELSIELTPDSKPKLKGKLKKE